MGSLTALAVSHAAYAEEAVEAIERGGVESHSSGDEVIVDWAVL
jgi:hypothetical protein